MHYILIFRYLPILWFPSYKPVTINNKRIRLTTEVTHNFVAQTMWITYARISNHVRIYRSKAINNNSRAQKTCICHAIPGFKNWLQILLLPLSHYSRRHIWSTKVEIGNFNCLITHRIRIELSIYKSSQCLDLLIQITTQAALLWCPSINSMKYKHCNDIPPGTQELWFLGEVIKSTPANL